jgi:hypothetical protein
MIFINGVAFEKVGSKIWIVSCTVPLHRTYTIVSAEQQYLCSTYFDMSLQYRNKSKSQLNSPTPAQLPAVAVSSGHIGSNHVVVSASQ